MSGPETLYAAMTSGDVGTVHGVESDVSTAMGEVRDAIELIRYAADKPTWSSPSARTRFNMRAWATRASAEIAFIRLNRAKLALQRAAADYVGMKDAATSVIEQWRKQKALITDPISLLLFRAAVMLELLRIRADYGIALGEAQDFVESDPLTDDQEAWLQNGMVRSMRRDLEHPGDAGPIIPGTLATGDDDHGWTPQGLGYDPESGYLIQTSYNHDGAAQLSLVDPDTGELVRTVDLSAYEDPETHEKMPPPDHAGGVAVHDGSVWITSSGADPTVYQYSMADITSSAPGDPVPVQSEPQGVRGGAYSTIVGDTMYVGTFEEKSEGSLYTYTWDRQSGTWSSEQGPFATPPQTQGIAVRGGEVVFSTSWGRENGGTLQSYNLPDVLSGGALGDPIRSVDLPNMSEGVASLPSGLVTTFESGSSEYTAPNGSPLEDLWASMNMTVTPYSDLGLAGGAIEVEPATLTEASTLFAEAEAGLDGVERRAGRLDLPASSLGDVPGAGAFATAIRTHCDTTGSWLAQGKLSASITASGLVAAASDYEDSDSASGGLFDTLRGLIP